MIFFNSLKNLAKILAFSAQTTATLYKNLIIALFFEKKTPISSPKVGENRRKL
jgi:hypothetical protein